MARIHLSFGSCPVCGDHVPRTIQQAGGLQEEIFHCETHGRIAYSTQHSVRGLVQSISDAIVRATQPAPQPMIDWVS